MSIGGIYYVPARMPHPLIELGGVGPPVVLFPANGFPPETYVPALRPLMARHRVVSLPPRALWSDAGPPPAMPGSWVTLGDDLLTGWRLHGLASAIVVGHSFGGVAALLAAARESWRFKALALLDPTILPPAIMEEYRLLRERGLMSARPLVQAARKRRDRFESEPEAFAYWRGKPLFADWSDDAVWRYTRAMLRPSADGGFALTWPAAWEAHYYESFYPPSWEEVDRLPGDLPILVVGGTTSDTFLPEAVALMRAKLPLATHRTIAGGHLFPHSAPVETGRMLAEWVELVGGGR